MSESLLSTDKHKQKIVAMLCWPVFLIIVLLHTPSVCGPNEQTPAAEFSPEPEPYACVPSSAAVILAYFGREPNDAQFTKQFRVQADGYAPAGDLIRVCKRYGLYCKAYRDLSMRQTKDYLERGFAVVVVTQLGRQHAVSLFGAKQGILTTDLLQPLHLANIDNLQRALLRGAVSIVIGENPIPSPKERAAHWYLLCLLVTCISTSIYFLFFSKSTKGAEK
jgi:hypothetical protein